MGSDSNRGPSRLPKTAGVQRYCPTLLPRLSFGPGPRSPKGGVHVIPGGQPEQLVEACTMRRVMKRNFSIHLVEKELQSLIFMSVVLRPCLTTVWLFTAVGEEGPGWCTYLTAKTGCRSGLVTRGLSGFQTDKSFPPWWISHLARWTSHVPGCP